MSYSNQRAKRATSRHFMSPPNNSLAKPSRSLLLADVTTNNPMPKLPNYHFATPPAFWLQCAFVFLVSASPLTTLLFLREFNLISF